MPFNKMKVVFIGALRPTYELWCPHFMGVKSALKKMGLNHRFLCCRSNAFYIQETIEFQPDLVILGLIDPLIQYFSLAELREYLPKAKIVLWYGDLRNERTRHAKGNYRKLLDAMFVSNNGQEAFWKQELNIDKVYFLPLACDPLEKPSYSPKLAFSRVFIGAKNFNPEYYKRAVLINDFEKIGVKRVDSQIPEMREKVYRNMPLIYGSSKISLDISHYTDIPGYTSVRYWEIPAMWGFALTKRFPGCEEFYPETMRAYFDGFDEAREKMRFYLEHETERKKMVELAHAHSYNHTHEIRLKEMFKKLELSN